MESQVLFEWLKILIPITGAVVVLWGKIARLQSDQEGIVKEQEVIHKDIKELLRRDVFAVEQEAIKSHLRTIDSRLERIERKIFNGPQ